jgi:hypothetical protein
MSLVQKRGIAPNAVDETKVLLNNNAYLQSLNSSAAAANLIKLNASNLPELPAAPVHPDPTLAQQSATKTYVDTGLALKINSSLIGANSGVASLDSGGKIPSTQLPSTVMEYQGNWSAATNTPTLADGTGSAGDVYRVNAAGTQNLGSGSQTFAVGDWVVYNGTIWQLSLNSNAVGSVNGFTGTVVLTTTNIAEGTNLYYTQARFDTAFAAKTTSNLAEGSNLYFTNARAIAAPLTGYVSGAGTVAATDSVLQAIQKLNGNVTALGSAVTGAKNNYTLLAGDITAKNYTLPSTPRANTLILSAYGVVQREGTDYTVSGAVVSFTSGGDLFSTVIAGDIISTQYLI